MVTVHIQSRRNKKGDTNCDGRFKATIMKSACLVMCLGHIIKSKVKVLICHYTRIVQQNLSSASNTFFDAAGEMRKEQWTGV